MIALQHVRLMAVISLVVIRIIEYDSERMPLGGILDRAIFLRQEAIIKSKTLKMARKNKFSGLTLVEFVILATLVGIVISIVWVSFNSIQRKKAVTTFKENVMSVRGDITMCASEISGMLRSGMTGEEMCVDGLGKYPEVPEGCGDKPVFFFTDSRAESWKLTTTTDIGGRTAWDCHGCRPVCQANGCTFVETEPGDCY